MSQASDRELALLRLLIESVHEYAIFRLDAEGRVASWNPGAQRIKGYTAEEIIGRPFYVFYPEEDVRAGVCELELERAKKDGRFEGEGWRIRKDGSRFWAGVLITPLREDNRVVGFVKITRDLTDRRNADLERIRLAQAEEAVRLRDEFLSIASHELKTPLTAIDLQVHALLERIDRDDEKTARKLKRLERGSARLRDLIETMLDVSRIATGRLTLNRTEGDLVGLIEEVVERLAELAADAGCQVTLDKRTSHAMGYYDPLRVEQVITNVLENAMKYGAGKPVRLVVDSEGGHATVEIVDQGPGIPPGDLERIFGRFERAASRLNYGGFGLGLFLAREIVSAHGGTITAQNEPAAGARIRIRLPLGAQPAPAQRPPLV